MKYDVVTLAKNQQANIFKTEVEEIQVALNDAVDANPSLIIRPSASGFRSSPLGLVVSRKKKERKTRQLVFSWHMPSVVVCLA